MRTWGRQFRSSREKVPRSLGMMRISRKRSDTRHGTTCIRYRTRQRNMNNPNRRGTGCIRLSRCRSWGAWANWSQPFGYPAPRDQRSPGQFWHSGDTEPPVFRDTVYVMGGGPSDIECFAGISGIVLEPSFAFTLLDFFTHVIHRHSIKIHRTSGRRM